MSQKIDRHSEGVFIIAATPFASDGALDLDSTDRMIEFYLDCGVSGMTILGIMGEAPKLTAEESAQFANHVLERVAGRVPVVVGVSGAGLDNMARLSHSVMGAGAAGVMVAPMPGLATEAKLRNYFGQVCAALGPDVPVCLQDYPQTTGVQFSVETILQLTRDHDQIVMLKHEDWPGLTKLSRVRAESGTGDTPRLSILTGNAALFLPLELQRGADGAMTGFAYPEMLVQVVERHKAGDVDGAEDLFDAYLPMVRYEQQLGIGLAIRKEILHRRGVLAAPKVRAPGPSMTEDDHAELTRLMDRLDRKLAALG
ncbi:dihydrodipicolinate synthase family protein [Marivita sp. XM-24bin2]|jgi:4-hydroxy-tetrahydrodipicolinate synthase|uniref:dihydrodipicolinate synthase family protein n=1 Tax=unclassified Marivita TaxID=2632480 RepID=UPI000D79FD92|nr:dihydrodipicolinate synthase family protein [Marivita sp. XM-24bin2]MCR9107973.1 dihydrodipicolinate synthase family protein [Paracoccaceae bacterium]PWL35047.1 MAG: dihydrodipicolinate synthase family protein [Marivita sp. XM-24bin2]